MREDSTQPDSQGAQLPQKLRPGAFQLMFESSPRPSVGSDRSSESLKGSECMRTGLPSFFRTSVGVEGNKRKG